MPILAPSYTIVLGDLACKFYNKKSLKTWFKALTADQKKECGEKFNKALEFFNTIQEINKKHDHLESKSHSDILRERYNKVGQLSGENLDLWYDLDHCSKCGSLRWDCHCWLMDIALRGTEDKGGYPPNLLFATPIGVYFVCEGFLCVKTKFNIIESLESDNKWVIGDWWEPVSLRWNYDLWDADDQ